MRELTVKDWFVTVSQLAGVGRKTMEQLLPFFREFSPEHPLDGLADLSSPAISPQRLNRIRHLSPEQVLKTKRQLQALNIQTLTILDPEYPEHLREISDPPHVLYAIGNLGVLQGPAIAIVGTRFPTNYGRQAAFRLAETLGRFGMTVVSGMAKGIDAEAHKGALCSGGTIAVLGCGIDTVYPPQHENLYQEIAANGLILSEYPPGTSPHPVYFPQRNRIISGLSLGVVVVEAADKSGSLITADLAMEQGREVFAVPGSIFSAQSLGPNRLIKEGAKLVSHVQDIVEEFSYLTGAMDKNKMLNPGNLTVKQRQVLDMIENTQMSVDQLAAAASLSVQEVLTELFTLQLLGKVRQLPGGRYLKV